MGKFFDLLDNQKSIHLSDFVGMSGAKEVKIKNMEDLKEIIKIIINKRQASSTKMNQ